MTMGKTLRETINNSKMKLKEESYQKGLGMRQTRDYLSSRNSLSTRKKLIK